MEQVVLDSVTLAPPGSREFGSCRKRLTLLDLEIINATVGDILKVSLWTEGKYKS
jgi:hypothetical protein